MPKSAMPTASAPVPFIQVDPKTKRLVVTPEARKALSAVSGTCGVAAVAGVYRTAKSYILNQLAGTTGGGFGVGNSVQAKTKGIWLWGAPLNVESSTPGAPQHVLLLDTEGLQSIDQTEGHDAKIFCLAILLSSFFIYNSEKAINNAAIDQLSLVAQLTQRIRVHAEGEGSRPGTAADASPLSQYFPSFTWLLRDFQLELLDGDGAAITPNAYLESCLQPAPGSSAAVQEQNATRTAIRDLFTERSCIALPHPTLGTSLPTSALKALDTTPLSKLHAEFASGVTQLKRRVYEGVRAKSLGPGGPALNGPMLLQLATSYCDAINDGALPTISTAWQAVITLECQRALDEAARLYTTGAAAFADAEAPPDEAAWHAEHARLLDASLSHFKSLAIGEGPAAAQYETQLRSLISAECGRVEALLSARSAALCERLISSLVDRFAKTARAAAATADGATPAASSLPSALTALVATYQQQASGASKSAGLESLLSRAAPLMSEAIAAVESAKARAAEAAGLAATAAKSELQAMKRRAADAESAMATKEEELRSAREKLDSERASLSSAHTSSAKLAAQLTQLTGDAGKQEARIATLESGTAQKDTEIRTLRDELSRQRTESQQREAALTTRDARVTELCADLERAKGAAATANGQLETERKLVASMQSTLAQLNLDLQRERASAREHMLAPPPSTEPPVPVDQSPPPEPVAAAPAPAPSSSRRGNKRGARSAVEAEAPAPSAEPVVDAEEAATVPPPGSARRGTKRGARSAPEPAVEAEAPAPSAEPVVAAEAPAEVDAADADGEVDAAPRKRRSSIDTKDLSIPVLQTRLKQILGPNAKLPKKKPDLLAMYIQHYG